MKALISFLVLGAVVVLGVFLLSGSERGPVVDTTGILPELPADGTVDDRAAQTGAASSASSAVDAPISADVIETITQEVAIQDAKTYQNDRYRFVLSYPAILIPKEYDEGGGARTISFEDPERLYGFQIFVTPYGQEAVSPERLRRDLPSGVVERPSEVSIAGARGTHFFSRNPIMGETTEVWFIHDGFLYEVNTYAELDTWLAQIMTTWKFL